MVNKQLIVFTDMDGTLLDHHTYSHAPATAMLAKLKHAKVPVIPTTSKTFAELKVLRQEIGLDGPFIVENGAAIHIPHGFFRTKPASTQWQDEYWLRQFTSRKNYWLSLLEKVGKNYPGQYNHFSAMSTEHIVDATGLSEEAAVRAADRQYGEPVLWLGDSVQKQKFLTELRLKGAKPLQGGRFIHISGECNKGMALQWFVKEFNRQYPNTTCVSIALGDGENDIAMLEAADYAVRILSPSHKPPKLDKQDNVITSTSEGPAGWSESLEKIISSQQ
jgi:mannosyl-3-phosphoglycerate phosphatase